MNVDVGPNSGSDSVTTPIVPERRVTSARAALFRRYPSSTIAASTRSRVASRTLGCPLSTRETVWCETPATCATSLIAGGRCIVGRVRTSRLALGPGGELGAHLDRPVPTGLGSGDHRGAHAALIELPHRRNRRPAGRRHTFAEDRWALTGLRHEGSSALNGRDSKLRRKRRGQPEQHTGLGHRLDQVEGCLLYTSPSPR